jgi:DNA-directed RNA polymerase specialized sigma24 family protein
VAGALAAGDAGPRRVRGVGLHEDTGDRFAVGLLVQQALAALPRRQRAVLVLRYCEDLPEAEVASLLGCSAGTVKTHAHRGLRALRALLGELAAFQVNER